MMKWLYEKENRYKFLLIFGVVMLILPITMQVIADYRLRDNQKIVFTDIKGNSIFNTYYPGDRNFGVMLFHGMGEDQTSLDLYTSQFSQQGLHVFCTDFSGHGRSSGLIPSGNNSVNDLALQVLRAKTKFKELSGLEDSEIFLLGHSMGAGGIMKAVTIDSNPVNGCIILGSALGASNDNETTTWVDELGPTNPMSNILIVTGAWDDVAPPPRAMSLYYKLANETDIVHPQSTYSLTPEGLVKEITIFKYMTHTHESMSARSVLWMGNWIERIVQNKHPAYSHITPDDYEQWLVPFDFLDFRIWGLLMELGGIFVALIFGTKLLGLKQEQLLIVEKEENESSDQQTENSKLAITNIKKFIGYKLLIWLGGAVIAIIIALNLAYLPNGIPYFTLLFVCPISGYGLMMLILYSLDRMPGLVGKWRPKIKQIKENMNWRIILFGLVVFGIITAVFSYFISSSLYHVFPLNIRLLWLAIFTVLSLPGFYFLQIEAKLIRNYSEVKDHHTKLNSLAFLAPFIIGALYILFSGTIIYFIDALNDIIILSVIILVGNLMQKIWKKPFLTALLQSFLLFFLLLPRGQMTLLF
ncbi:MAG: alpha/beta fold hydrolase [Candidatus Heimdallarchaeota archaeon]|nr:alpha/beta fold hydrolase [Candidatus Heimdallarchaeota archaeon]MBY8995213.1 alpha/beta fold hydrolase [Candidatus Heimdallarchaeota archaeon]